MKKFFKDIGIIAMTAVMVFGFAACGGGKKANFGKYPADYPIAYVANYGARLGLPNPLTVEALFGSSAYFITSYNDAPVVVTFESSEGTKESFTAQLLLSTKASKETGNKDVKISRLQVTFESNSLSEMSYLRHVKVIDMVSGQIKEEKSNGDEMSDLGVFAFFAGFWSSGTFWDVSKYKQ